jgi:ABC-type transporter Mla subunit MlaD
MAERNMRVRLGAFVTVTLTALTGLVVLFGGRPTLFSDRVRYVVTFPEAPGLAPGTPVRKSGVRIGQVTGLDIDEDTGGVRVNVEIAGKHLPRQNEEPAISRGLLSGDTTLDFIPKVDRENAPIPRGEPYASGAVIAGVPPLNTQRLINQAQGTIPDAQAALAQFNRTIGRFEQVGPKAERALDEIAALVKSGREVVPELRQTNLRIQEFVGQSDEQPGNLKAVAKELQEFLKVLGPFVEDLRTVLNDNREDLTRTLKGIAQLTDRANDVLNADNRKALADSLKNIQTGSKGFNELFGPENRKNLSDTLKNLSTGSDDLTKAVRLAAILVDRADTTLKELNRAIAAGADTIQKAGKTVDEATARVAQTKGVIDNIERATKPLADNAEPTIKNIARAADELAKTVADTRQVIALLTRPEGTLGKVVSDPQLYNQLVDAAANLNRTLIRAEKIAKDLEVFADKVARKPETIGVGGALRPSTGLKESPYAPVPGNTPYPGPTGGGGSGGAGRPIAPVPGGADDPLPPVSSFKVEPGPRVSPLPPVRPQILGEPK